MRLRMLRYWVLLQELPPTSGLSLEDGKTSDISDWPSQLQGPFDVVVSMQSVHELRHKRRAELLYGQARTLLRPDSVLVVCDHA